jgi:acetyl-CoA synthetase
MDYRFAQQNFSWDRVWEFFDGDKASLNIAHECVDRHATDGDRVAVRIAHADGPDEAPTFREIADWSSRFAHWLAAHGVAAGDRVAVMLDPSLLFYVAMFGTMKRGAIAVPLFTLFGPEGVRLRVADCRPKILLLSANSLGSAEGLGEVQTVVADAALLAELAAFPTAYEVATRTDDLALFQYTSGTTRELPDAVKHTHRAIVVLMLAALYGTGIRPGDEFFCPSSPAWGHGLAHGTLAPLALGVTTGTYAGKFDPARLMRALQDYRITNLSAAATHYRMMRTSGRAAEFHFHIRKLSYTGEPIDAATLRFIDETFGVPACSMYGTTEVGVVLVNYPGAGDFHVKPGSLGRPVPGARVEVQRPDGSRCGAGEIGEIRLWRRGQWVATKDLGHFDEDGYFYHAGRADDVIISAGWTMSAVEIEDVLLKHPDVREAAAVGVPDPLRGQVVKAFVISDRVGDMAFVRELQDFSRARLSHHEYPRQIEFVTELPKTPAGKVNRWIRCAGASADASSKASSRGATRRHATTFGTTRMGLATTIPCGAIPTTRRAARSAASSRCPASCSRPAGSSLVMSAACRGCTRCGQGLNGGGTAGFGGTRKSGPRGGCPTSSSMPPASRGAPFVKSTTSTSMGRTAIASLMRKAGFSAPTAMLPASAERNMPNCGPGRRGATPTQNSTSFMRSTMPRKSAARPRGTGRMCGWATPCRGWRKGR